MSEDDGLFPGGYTKPLGEIWIEYLVSLGLARERDDDIVIGRDQLREANRRADPDNPEFRQYAERYKADR